MKGTTASRKYSGRGPGRHSASEYSRAAHRWLPRCGLMLVLSAVVPVGGGVITNAVPDLARPLPLTAVRLTGGPLKTAQELDLAYLLSLEPDRMLAGYRLRAGLPPKATAYDGWDSVEGKQLTGHIAGHYLSAVSLMFAATGDVRCKACADYLVQQLAEVQAARGTGYLGAITDQQGRDGAAIFDEIGAGNIRSTNFDLNGLWSPWYTLHKTFAGLRDAYRYTGNTTALAVSVRFAAWVEHVLARLDDTQLQSVLNTEFGGMPEVLADLYADTGETRWLVLSHRFDHRAVLDPLVLGEDRLEGLHGNTQVPKLYGTLARYAYAGQAADEAAARNFWRQVVDHHSFATGGHGQDEYFGPADQLADRLEGRTAETCNVYNMLKFTRRLFALQPDIRYAEFHERALFNHLLASMNLTDGRTSYMVPVGRGVRHDYQDMQHDFTCCVGTGMESPALHGDGIYYESAGKLWVNLYAPSTAEWAAAGLKLIMASDFPSGESARLDFSLKESRIFTLALRRPSWAGEGFSIKVNGQMLSPLAAAGSYVEISRRWQTGDTVELILPKQLRLEPMPDNPGVVAILWGPLVLAGDLGPPASADSPGESPSVPALVAASRPVTDWLKPVPGRPGEFRSAGVGREHDVDFVPFYRLPDRIYGIYWDLLTAEQWEQRAAESAAEKSRQAQLDRITVAKAFPGESLAERNSNFQGPEDSGTERVSGRPGRNGRSWFSYDLPVDPAHPLGLVVTYHSGVHRRPRLFTIMVNGHAVGRQEVKYVSPPHFYDVTYPVLPEYLISKSTMTVRFQAEPNAEIATVFGLRLIRADQDH